MASLEYLWCCDVSVSTILSVFASLQLFITDNGSIASEAVGAIRRKPTAVPGLAFGRLIEWSCSRACLNVDRHFDFSVGGLRSRVL
jgi:hypothetical protein